MAEKKFYSPASDSKRQLFIEPKSVIKEESFLTKVANKLPFVNVNKGVSNNHDYPISNFYCFNEN